MTVAARMKAWMVPLLLASAFAFAPPAGAHQCTGESCGPCTDGEAHQHTDYRGNVCQSGPQGSQEAGPDGASQSVPFGGALLVAAGVALALVAARRGA